MIFMQEMLDEADVIADYRERKVIEYLKDLKVKISALPVSDFIVSGKCAVERKSLKDFANSVKDKRIFKQAEELKQFESGIIVIEGGSLFDIPLHPNAVMGAISSLILDFKLNVINTSDAGETAALIRALVRREKKERREIGLRGEKKPKDIKRLQEYIIQGLPNVGPVLSKRLLKRFKSVKGVINAGELELIKVDGIGKEKAKLIKKVVESEY